MHKRPRGRPPLSAKRKFESLSSVVANSPRPSTPLFVATNYVQPIFFPPVVLPNQPAIENSSSVTDGKGKEDGDKYPKPSISAQRIFSRLMVTGEPLSFSEISKIAPESPKEHIQSILEVLQILGFVVQLKSRSVKDQSFPLGGNMYALQGFAKGSQSTDIQSIEAATKSKIARTQSTRERIAALKVTPLK